MIAYQHEPLTDFTNENNREAFQEALKRTNQHLGQEYPLVIDGKLITTKEKIISRNPANKTEVIGFVSKANQELAEKAIQAAAEAFESWRKTKPEMRADILFKAAAIIRSRKHEFSALMVKEAGKSWIEIGRAHV